MYIGVRQPAFHCARKLCRIGGTVKIRLIRNLNNRSKMNDYARCRMNIREPITDTKVGLGRMPFRYQ